MKTPTFQAPDSLSPDEIQICTLYQHLLTTWNERNATAFAAHFTTEGDSIGYDGSELKGQKEIATTLQEIFNNHQTPTYISKVRSIQLFHHHIAILRAIVGMILPTQSEIEPTLNAHQTLIASRENGTWRITLLQNTPAQFHGRPDLAEQLTEELRQVLK